MNSRDKRGLRTQMRALWLVALLVSVPGGVLGQTSTPTRTPTVTPTSTPKATSTGADLVMARIGRKTPGASQLVEGRQPTPGSTSLWLQVEVYNGGGATITSATVSCSLNGTPFPLFSDLSIAPGESTIIDLLGTYNHPTEVTCTGTQLIPPVQTSTDNDTLTVDATGLAINFFVEEGVWDYFNVGQWEKCAGACYGRATRSSMWDWAQSAITKLNAKFEANKASARFFLNDIIIVPDGWIDGGGSQKMCEGGQRHLETCSVQGDCVGGVCSNCTGFTYPAINGCDSYSDGAWPMLTIHLTTPRDTPFFESVPPYGAPPTYTTAFDVDDALLHELIHAVGAVHTGSTTTLANRVSILDPNPTPVASTERMPDIGTCQIGGNLGLFCLQTEIATDCGPPGVGSQCQWPAGLSVVSWPPPESDFMGGEGPSSDNVTTELRTWIDDRYRRRCHNGYAQGGNQNRGLVNRCGYQFGGEAGLHDVFVVAYDSEGDVIPSTQIDFYRGHSEPATSVNNLFDNVSDFSVTTNGSGIARIGAYPHFDTAQPTASWCNIKDATNTYCSVFGREDELTGQFLLLRDKNNRFNPTLSSIGDPDHLTDYADFNSVAGPFSFTTSADCTNCGLVARIETGGEVSYTWLYQSVLAGLRQDGHLRAYVPLWFPQIDHVMRTTPDLVVNPLEVTHDVCSNGGRCWRVWATVSNLGQPMVADWVHRFTVEGSESAIATNRKLWIGDTTGRGLSQLARPDEEVCITVDPDNLIAEAREDNNQVCVTVPATTT